MNTHQATSDFNFVTTTRTIAEARLRFGYVTPSQAAWLKTFFRQSETTLEDYLMDPNIAADPHSPRCSFTNCTPWDCWRSRTAS